MAVEFAKIRQHFPEEEADLVQRWLQFYGGGEHVHFPRMLMCFLSTCLKVLRLTDVIQANIGVHHRRPDIVT